MEKRRTISWLEEFDHVAPANFKHDVVFDLLVSNVLASNSLTSNHLQAGKLEMRALLRSTPCSFATLQNGSRLEMSAL